MRVKRDQSMMMSMFMAVTAGCLIFSGLQAEAIPLSQGAALQVEEGDPTADFKFVVPPLPGQKTAVGENAGWGGLFVSFTEPVNTVTFAVTPVLDDCVDEPAAPVNADNQLGAAPADSWLWKCRHGYQLDPKEHQGLTVTIHVTSDNPIVLLVDKSGAPDPNNTFWWQKQDFNDDATLRFFAGTNDTPPAKLAALPVPQPYTLVLLVGGLGALVLGWPCRRLRVRSARRVSAS